MRKIVIEKELFSKYPDFQRGVIIIKEIQNPSFNMRISKLLEEQIERTRGVNLIEHEFVKAWDEIHRGFGSNPNKFPPSIKSLLKRVEKGDKIPFINCVVALFNFISLKYLIPCGGDDVEKVEGNLRLGFASGNEIFIPLGGKDQENPVPGEVIYYDDLSKKVMCRKWNWRNGDFSKIGEKSTKIVINVDGAGVVHESILIQARDELANLLIEECSAKVSKSLLNKERNEIEIEI